MRCAPREEVGCSTHPRQLRRLWAETVIVLCHGIFLFPGAVGCISIQRATRPPDIHSVLPSLAV